MKYIKQDICFILIIGLFLFTSFASASDNFILTYKNGTVIDGSNLNTSETRLIINATNDHLLGFIIYGLNKISNPIFFSKLCSICQPNVPYTRTLFLSDGNNNILIRDSDGANKSINVTVDTKKPSITKIIGVNSNGYSKGIINITFIEANPQSAILNYREPSDSIFSSITADLSNDCSNIANQWNCQFNITNQSGKLLILFFNISDNFNTIGSRTFNQNIDSKKPIIQAISLQNNSQFPSGHNIPLSLGTDEASKISYDINHKGRLIRLCGSSCTFIQSNIRLQRGNYIIRFFAEDIAGNIAIDSRTINII
jgi:hypothetical protein